MARRKRAVGSSSTNPA